MKNMSYRITENNLNKIIAYETTINRLYDDFDMNEQAITKYETKINKLLQTKPKLNETFFKVPKTKSSEYIQSKIKINHYDDTKANSYDKFVYKKALKTVSAIENKTYKLKAIEKVKEKLYTANVLIYRRYTEEEYTEMKKQYTNVKHFKHQGLFYVQMKNMLVNGIPDLTEYANKRIFDDDQGLFNRINSIICTHDTDYNDYFSLYSSYINAITLINFNIHEDVVPINPLVENLHYENINNGITNKYITYALNKQAADFSQLFKIELQSYTLENYKANSCYVNIIIDHFKPAFTSREKRGKKAYKTLTYAYLCDIIGLTNLNEDLGLSIQHSIKFFEKFRLGLDVINVYNEIMFNYRPTKLNDHIKPNILRILVHNNHCYKLNNNIASFDQLKQRELNDVDNLTLSDKYTIVHFNNDIDVKMVSNIDEIVKECIQHEAYINEIIKDSENTTHNLTLIYNNNMNNLLFEIVKNNNYYPDYEFSSGVINNIRFNFKHFNVCISKPNSIDTSNNDIQMNNINEYKLYHSELGRIYNHIINKKYMSYSNDITLTFEYNYRKSACCGYFDNYDKGFYNAIDIRKAYTHALTNINMVPVFSYFDIYERYDNHDIDPYTMYYIYCESTDKGINILFPKQYDLHYGIKLIEANRLGIKFNILKYRRPSNLIESDFKTPIDELYKTDLCTDMKKFIVNVCTGLLEKLYNKKSISRTFNNRSEAQYYINKYGGTIYVVNKELDQTVDHENNDYTQERLYIVVTKKEKLINEGFRPIKNLIYDMHSITLFKLYTKCIQNNIKPLGIKTDCIIINEDYETVQQLFDFSEVMGGCKFETYKTLINTNLNHQLMNNSNKCNHDNNIIDIKNEYDQSEINKVFDMYNKVLVKALLPGAGKTTAITKYNKDILIVCPFNTLCQELQTKGFDCITLNKLLGLRMDNEIKLSPIMYDVSQYKMICFDEIYLYNIENLKRIDEYMNMHKDIKFLATGDPEQNEPIGLIKGNNNTKSDIEYLNYCINIMFKQQIVLKQNKRLKNEEDKIKLIKLRQDIFNLDIPIVNIIKKYGFKCINDINDLTTINNVAFFNFRCEQVNSFIHKNIVKAKQQYYKGLHLICKAHYKGKNGRLYKNFEYEIIDINDKQFIIKDIVEKEQKLTLDIKLLSHFKLPYVRTCHSLQGLSIDDKICIFDINAPHVSRNWIWTAITRCTLLDNITVFIHSDKEINSLTKSKLSMYYNMKINNYKAQDSKAKRQYKDEEYITVNWLNNITNKFNKCSCGVPFETYLDNNNIVKSNITVDRLDSSKAHVQNNCQLLCINCNCSKKNL